MVEDPVPDDDPGGGGPRRERELVPAERAGMGAGRPHVQALVVEDRGDRHPDPAERLRDDHDVGDDPGVLEREPPAGPSAAALHLVENERDVELVRQAPQSLEKLRRRRNDASLALHRLDEHGRRAGHASVRVREHALEVREAARRARVRAQAERAAIAVRIREEVDARDEVRHRLLLREEPAERHRAVGAAVEAAVERDDVAAARRRLAELERRVDGVLAGGAAELDAGAALHLRRQEVELYRDELVLDRRRKVEPVAEQLELPADCVDDLGMVVPERQDARAGEEVDVDVAVDVADERPCRALDRDRQPARVRPRARLVGLLALQVAARGGARNGGPNRRPLQSDARARHLDLGHVPPPMAGVDCRRYDVNTSK